jgi:hypothetical protein
MSSPAIITTANSLSPIASPDASPSPSPSIGGKKGGGKAYGTIPIVQDAWAVPVVVEEATVVPFVTVNNNNDQQYHPLLHPNHHPTTTTTTTSHLVRILRVTTERRGQSCCGFCCDMRRAVLILNGFLVILYSIGVWNTVPSWSSHRRDHHVENDDDDNDNDTWRFLKMLLKLICFVLGMWGALSFSTWQLYFPIMVHLHTIVVSCGIIFSDWDVMPIGIGISFLYPHVVLMQEIQNGILSKETYPFEAQSCCCV